MIALGPRKKFLGAFLQILSEIFGELFERIIETGILTFILKFYFGLSIKTAIITAIILATLTFCKHMYYKEDFYLAFAIMMIFHENIFLSWLMFLYISYFRTKSRNIVKKGKFETFKYKYLGLIGEIFTPLILVFVARKFKAVKNNVFVLLLLIFIHHLNYFILRLVDIFLNIHKYTIKEVKEVIIQGLKDTRFNIIITLLFIMLFKGLIFHFAYNDVSWGFLDKLAEIFEWIF